MAIASIGNFQMMPFGDNPMQNLGTLVITALAVNAFASLPMAAAREAPNMDQEICEILCAPLPGDKTDAPEIVCQETCKKGGVTRAKEWMIGKLSDTMKLAGGIPAIQDCAAKCSKIYTGVSTAADFGEYIPAVGLGVKATATIATPVVYWGCIPTCITAKAWMGG